VEAILDNGARWFRLPNANMRAAAMAQRYIDKLERIARACTRPGPFLYTVHVDRLVSVRLEL